MPLPRFHRQESRAHGDPGPGVSDESPAVTVARRRARQRLIGALLLLAVGIVGFPLLFDTQPRSLPADTPIRLAQRDAGTVRAWPQASEAAGTPSAPSPVEAVVATPPEANGGSRVVQGTVQGTANDSVQGVLQAPPSSERPLAASAPAAGSLAGLPPALSPAAPSPSPAAASQPPAVLPARPAAAAATPAPAASVAAEDRFVVQVGAYSDQSTLRQARQRVEKLGLKTYTQVIGSGKEQRTRVRVGPFDTRAEAEAAAARLKAGGLPSSILAL
jgi:DedD protein